MREYHPVWGRWLTPDPAGLAAANPANPQSWNRHAYVLAGKALDWLTGVAKSHWWIWGPPEP